MAEHKSRNAYLRGWFAARARRRPPSSDDVDEKFFANNGFEAGQQNGGYALAPLVNMHATTAVHASLDLDLTAARSPMPKPRPQKAQPQVQVVAPEPEAILTSEAEAQLHGSALSGIGDTDENEDAPRQNHFLPQRKAGSSRMRAGPKRYKRG